MLEEHKTVFHEDTMDLDPPCRNLSTETSSKVEVKSEKDLKKYYSMILKSCKLLAPVRRKVRARPTEPFHVIERRHEKLQTIQVGSGLKRKLIDECTNKKLFTSTPRLVNIADS